MRPVVVVAFFLVFAAVAGAWTTSGRSQMGLLQGVVTRGPACSGQELHPCTSPLPGVKVVFVRGGRAVAQATTGAAGMYRIRLVAGLYGIRLPGHHRWRPTQVDVLRGTVMRVNIAIDAMTG